MSLDYALVTSSSLPNKVRTSPHYVSVDKAQWLDLVDYSQDLVDKDPDQKILFLIVAKGTEDQQREDEEKERLEALALDHENEKTAAEIQLAQEEKQNKIKLRSNSKSIFNALYGR